MAERSSTQRMSPAAEVKRLEQELAAAKEAAEQLKSENQLLTQGLEKYRARLRSIVDSAPYYIHIIDADLRVQYINKIPTGVAMEQVIGTTVGDFMAAKDRKRIRRQLKEVFSKGDMIQYEFPSEGLVGKLAWYRTTAGPIYENGKITGLMLITADITEDRLRTEALKQGKRAAEAARIRDRALLNSIGEGMIVIDQYARVANINPSGAQMLGYTPKELIGTWFPKSVPIRTESGAEMDPLERPAMRSLSSGQAVSEVVQYQRKDGSFVAVAVTISPVVINHKPVGAIEVFRDLTQERELEQAKEEFVSLASHQLRTPATGVKAYISMLLDGYAGSLTDRQADFLRKVYESNERQLQVVNDMLNVARVDAGRIIPERVSCNLSTILQDVIDEQRPIIKERRQDLEVTLPQQAVEGVIDPTLMRMAVENLVSNASKYTPEKGTLRVGLKQNDVWAEITVTDTGVGIAKGDLPKLFKRFSRIDNPLSNDRGGSGLGLYLAQNIILLHGGRMAVSSRPGKGTTFTVELPLQLKSEDDSE